MRISTGSAVKKALLVSAAAISSILVMASPAAAAVDDSFSASTTDGCGVVNFVDYGPGAAGGGNNDDYLVIHDYCSDGHGVMAYATLYFAGGGSVYLGQRYNGNGLAGAAVIWDPFAAYDNVYPGDTVAISVCLVDGSGDTTGSRCGSAARTSADG